MTRPRTSSSLLLNVTPPSNPAWPTGYIYGGGLSRNATHPSYQLDIAACYARDDDDTINLSSSGTLTVDLSSSGVNGLDTGTEQDSHWYYIWLIYNPITLTYAGLFSLSSTSPSMPSGYTAKRRLGSWYNNSAGNLRAATQIIAANGLRRYAYDGESALDLNVLKDGSSTSFADVNCSQFIPQTSLLGDFLLKFYTGTAQDAFLRVRPKGTGSPTITPVSYLGSAEFNTQAQSGSHTVTIPAGATICVFAATYSKLGSNPTLSTLTLDGQSGQAIVNSSHVDYSADLRTYYFRGFGTGAKTFAWEWSDALGNWPGYIFLFFKDESNISPVHDANSIHFDAVPVTSSPLASSLNDMVVLLVAAIVNDCIVNGSGQTQVYSGSYGVSYGAAYKQGAGATDTVTTTGTAISGNMVGITLSPSSQDNPYLFQVGGSIDTEHPSGSSSVVTMRTDASGIIEYAAAAVDCKSSIWVTGYWEVI